MPLVCQLPYLRGPLAWGGEQSPVFARALRLWPGLPIAQPSAALGHFVPQDYPFDPAQAAACLADFENMAQLGRDAATSAQRNAATANEMKEMASIGALAHAAGAEASPASAASAAQARLMREQAQKALLWIWLQEGRLADMASLASRYAKTSETLAAALDGADDDKAGLLPPDSPIALDRRLLPPWRLVLASALPFLPTDAVLLAEGDMREELLEQSGFQPAPDHAGQCGCDADTAKRLVALTASPAQVLGPTHAQALPREMACAQRLWLTWSAA